ncbi:MAG: SdrD B-like domain-containing protein [bacterium]
MAQTSFGASPPIGYLIVNTASVSYSDANGNPLTGVSEQVSTTVSGGSVPVVTITGNTDPVAMNGSLIYTIRYENAGNAAATGVTLSLDLSGYTAYVSSSGGGTYDPGGPGGGTVDWNLGNLAAGAEATITVDLRVKTTADYPLGDPAAIAQGALIHADTTLDFVTSNASDSIDTTVGTSPSLSLTLSASPTVVRRNGTIDYTFFYKNTGNAQATNSSVAIDLPDLTAPVAGSITGGGVLAGRRITWPVGDIPPGGEGTLAFQVTVSSIAAEGAEIRAIGSIICNELIPTPSNAVVVTVRNPSLSVTKTGLPARAGENAVFTIFIRNSSAIPITNVVASDPIPANTTFVSADEGGVYANGEVAWNIGALAGGGEKTVHITVQVAASMTEGQRIGNVVYVDADDVDRQTGAAEIIVSSRTPGAIEFIDPAGNEARVYHTGDNICVQVTDYDQNRNISAAENVVTELYHQKSGDQENVTLTETDVNTGVFRGCIISTADPAAPGDGRISVTVDSDISATYADPLDPYPVAVADALIDPFGVVFNSMTGEPVSGAVVTLIDADTGLPATVAKLPVPTDTNPAATTDETGFFAFRFVRPGRYYFSVNPGPKFTFPSIVPDAQLPPGFVIGVGSRREVFTLVAGMEPLNLDIPVDPQQMELLAVTKTAERKIVYIGDIVQYTVTVTNRGSAAVFNLSVNDTMPHGIEYLSGSTRINGVASVDPAGAGQSRAVSWSIHGLLPGASAEIVYSAAVGPDSVRGDGKNIAVASGFIGPRTVVSNNAYFTVKIKEGVFTSNGTIIGKVFADWNGDGIQNNGETGLKNVTLYLENGGRVVTDKQGKYSITGIPAGTHVIKIAEETLPAGMEPTVAGVTRSEERESTQLVELMPGGLATADFAAIVRGRQVTSASGAAKTTQLWGMNQGSERIRKKESATGESNSQTIEIGPGDGSADEEVRSSNDPGEALEEKIIDMTPELGFIYPDDGGMVGAGSLDIIVKTKLGSKVNLWINEKPISSKQIGRTVANSENSVVIYEYISLDLIGGEKNKIRAESTDADGNVTDSKKITVTVGGAPASIVVVPEKNEIPADGSTLTHVTIKVFDKNGALLSYSGLATVSVTAGTISGGIANGAETDTRVFLRGGVAEIMLRSPLEPGDADITASMENIKGEAKIFFYANLLDSIMFGVGEFKLGSGKSKGGLDYLRKNGRFDDGSYSDARGAFFAKKKIANDTLLTATYDSKKKKRNDLMMQSDGDVAAEDKYPLYGDESEFSNEARSQTKLYMRLDRRKSSLLYGDYQTGLTDTKLGAYSRTFNGFKTDIKTQKYKLTAFTSETNQTQVVDAIKATGISGYYYLTQAPVLDGSDMVSIETRDLRRPETVLARKNMARWSDYTIDYDRGLILFKEAVPSYDEDMNPVFIIASYESAGTGKNYQTYGGRGSYALSRKLTLGITGVTEEKEAGDFRLRGADATFQFASKAKLRVEAFRTDSLFIDGSAYTSKSGNGGLAEIKGKFRDRLDYSAYYKKTGDYFGNISAVDSQRGMTKRGFELNFKRSEKVKLTGKYFIENDRINSMSHKLASIGLRKEGNKSLLKAELLSESSNDRFTIAPPLIARYPFDNSDDTPAKTTAIKLGIEKRVSPKLSLNAEHQQDIQYNRNNLSTVGLDYRLTQSNHFYLRQEYWSFEERAGNRTMLGVESQVTRSTSAFNEYRLEGGGAGARLQQAIGLRNKFSFNKNLVGNIRVENLKTVSGEERLGEPDAFSYAVSTEYLPGKSFELTNRFEYRDTTSESSRLAEFGIGFKLNYDFSGLLKQRYYNIRQPGASNRTSTSTMLGFAYRPVDNNKLNTFMRFEQKGDRSSPVLYNATPNAFIFSIETIYQATKNLKILSSPPQAPHDSSNIVATLLPATMMDFSSGEGKQVLRNSDRWMRIMIMSDIRNRESADSNKWMNRLKVSGKYAGKMARNSSLESYTDLASGRISLLLTKRLDFAAEYRVMASHAVGAESNGGMAEFGFRLRKDLWLSLGYSFDNFDSDLLGDDYWGKGPYLNLKFKFDQDSGFLK